MSEPIVRWTLWHDGRTLTCTELAAPGGLEVQVTYDSLPLASQRCDRLEDAVRWSELIRQRWEATGWQAGTASAAPHPEAA